MTDQEKTNGIDTDFIKIDHRPSPHFINDFASGAVITGPTIENLFFLTFFAEAVSIKNEVGKVVVSDNQPQVIGNATTYELIKDEAEVENYREDKARIVMSKETLIKAL